MNNIIDNYKAQGKGEQIFNHFLKTIHAQKIHQRQVSISVYSQNPILRAKCILRLLNSPTTSISVKQDCQSFAQIIQNDELQQPYTLIVYDAKQFIPTNSIIFIVDSKKGGEDITQQTELINQFRKGQNVFFLQTNTENAQDCDFQSSTASRKMIQNNLTNKNILNMYNEIDLDDLTNVKIFQHIINLTQLNQKLTHAVAMYKTTRQLYVQALSQAKNDFITQNDSDANTANISLPSTIRSTQETIKNISQVENMQGTTQSLPKTQDDEDDEMLDNFNINLLKQ